MKKNRVNMFDLFNIEKEWLTKIILIIYIFAYLGATYNHVSDIVKYGFFAYQKVNENVPIFLNIFWTLLTFFDPLAITLLLFTTYYGLLVYGLIIVSDVILNYYFVITTYGLIYVLNFGQICQLLFLFFYLVTVIYVYNRLKNC